MVPSWMDSIVLFPKEDVLPEDKAKAEKVRRKATQFWLSDNQKLYKRSFFGPYLLYVLPETVESLLEELHEEICGICKRKLKTMQRSVTNARGSPLIFTNLGESSILYLVLGLSLNGAWTL